mgnify:CR=1 FL=1
MVGSYIIMWEVTIHDAQTFGKGPYGGQWHHHGTFQDKYIHLYLFDNGIERVHYINLIMLKHLCIKAIARFL